jgi:hypothetical protein
MDALARMIKVVRVSRAALIIRDPSSRVRNARETSHPGKKKKKKKKKKDTPGV